MLRLTQTYFTRWVPKHLGTGSSTHHAIYARRYSNRGTSLYPRKQPAPPTLRRADGYRHFARGPDRTPRTFYYVAGGLAALGGAWYVRHLERAPYTGRWRLMAMTREQENALGVAAFDELLRSSAVVPEGHEETRRVRRVGVRIARELKRREPELLKGFKWRFAVVRDDTPNAACAPGGKVVVFSGLLDLTHGDDDMLAAVLAHEIAHAVQRHSAERVSALRVLYALQALVNLVLDFGGITHLLAHLAISLPYSRTLELEADHVGLRLMADACYDPDAAKRMFAALERIQAEQGKETRTKNLLSTHPMFVDRIRRIDDHLLTVREGYQMKCGVQMQEWRDSMGRFSLGI